MKNNITFLTILLLTFGCVSTKYEPIDLSDELNYNREEISKKYIVDNEWWKAYNNKDLNNLVELALKNNIDYIKTALNVNKELYRLNLAKADLFPTLNGGLDISSNKDIYTGDNFSNSFSGEIGISYEIDLYGKIRDAKNAQEFEYKATVMDRESAKLALINSVVDLYYNMLYLNNSITATESSLKNYTEIYALIKDKYDNGSIDSLELLEAKQSVVSAKNDLLALKTQYKEIERSLRSLLNIKPSDKLNINFIDILEVKNIGADLDVPLTVLAERPDLKASQYRLERAFKELKAEEKSWYPSISIKGILGSSSNKVDETFDYGNILGNISISLPFLDWNRVRNNIKISEIDYQIELFDFKNNLNNALNEVAYYYVNYSNSESIFKNSEKKFSDSLKITNYYKERYNGGKIEFKDYLEALNTQNNLKIDLIRNKYQYLKYEGMVYKAMAGRYVQINK